MSPHVTILGLWFTELPQGLSQEQNWGCTAGDVRSVPEARGQQSLGLKEESQTVSRCQGVIFQYLTNMI